MTLQSTDVSCDGSQIAAARKQRFSQLLGKHRILLGLLLSYLAAASIIGIVLSEPMDTLRPEIVIWMIGTLAPVFLISMVVWRFGNMVLNVRPERPIAWLVADLRDCMIQDHERIFSGLIAFASIILFAATFTFVKDCIPLLNPFSWDPAFAELDRMMHGGSDPYVLLDPLFGNPLMTKLADGAYSLWFALIYFFAFTACMDKEDPLRRNTFLYAFFLCWMVGGSLLATIFSSVGPVYYDAFGFGDDFIPQIEALREIGQRIHLTALELQATLLDGYQNDGDLKGISAMPSMHLALAWLIAFQAFQYRKTFGWMMVVFAVIIQLSSVHLGWHYAIDGYVGLIVAVACWYAAKWLAKVQQRMDHSAQG